jgi:hypothetical protein
MANTTENTRSLMMDMSSVIARQPHDCIPARKMKDESVSVMFRSIDSRHGEESREVAVGSDALIRRCRLNVRPTLQTQARHLARSEKCQ